MIRPRILLPLLVLSASAACDRTSDQVADKPVGGTMIVSLGGEPDFLIPVITTTIAGNQVGDIIFERLAEPGDAMNTVGDEGFVPELADSWEWARDSMSIAFKLHPGARWHDGRPVTARDVRFSFDLHRDPKTGSPVAPLLSRIDSVSVRDSATAVFWYKRRYPEQFFDAAFQLRIFPEHWLGQVPRDQLRSSAVVRSPIGSGRFRFVSWDQGSRLEVVADTQHYRGRPALDRIVWTVAPDFNTSIQRLMTGEADFAEYLRPENLKELPKNPRLTTARYGSLDYGFAVFNLRAPGGGRPHPVFGDAGVRRALSMAVDRQKAVQNVFGELGVVALGPVPRALLAGDTTLPQIPYDPEAAKRLLDSLGWRDTNGDGVREKAGRALTFSLLAPTSSQNRVRLSVLLQEMMRQVGAGVELDHVELNTMMQRLGSRRWDAALMAWHTDPTPSSISQSWSTQASRAPDGSNYGGYENATFDALVDSATIAADPTQSRRYYRRAYETILADAPAIWLYEPVTTAGHDRRIRPAFMRPDAWWARIAEWSIPPNERLPRDNIGLARSR